VALAGCGAVAPATDVPPAPAVGLDVSASPDSPDSPDAGASPATDGLAYPACDEVFSVLGPEASDLVIAADADNGEVEGSSGRELSCVWMTPQAAANSLDLQNYGGVSVGVHRDPSYVESDYDALGWTIDDPRLDAENAWALTAGGNYDGGAVVDIGSIQVVRDGTIVTISATGAMLNEVPQLADLTQSWAVGAGLRILDLMR
jgi:hypothetical protein